MNDSNNDEVEYEKDTCPICGTDVEVSNCEHLFFHGDDLSTYHLAEYAGCLDIWSKLPEEDEDSDALSDDAVEFLNEHYGEFPSIAEVQVNSWGGDDPGRSGDYCFIWAEDSQKLSTEICQFLKTKLKEISVVITLLR